MAKDRSERTLPVTLFHKDNGEPDFWSDARHSKFGGHYPIVVHTQEDYDRLGPGWHESPTEAANWVNPDAPTAAVTDAPPTGGHNPEPESDAAQASALLDGSVADIAEQVEEMDHVEFLQLMAQVETTGKNRKGVQTAIAARLEMLVK